MIICRVQCSSPEVAVDRLTPVHFDNLVGLARARNSDPQCRLVVRRREVGFESLKSPNKVSGDHGRRAAASAARSNSVTRASMSSSSTPFNGAIKHALSRPKFHCRGNIRIGHEFQYNCRRSACSLLHPRNRLMNGLTAGFAIFFTKVRQLQPANQCSCAYPCSASCFLDVPLRQERSNRVFLFTPEFFAVSCHQVPSDAIRGRARYPSPNLRLVRFFPELTCIVSPSEQFM